MCRDIAAPYKIVLVSPREHIDLGTTSGRLMPVY
jgi:hypothetical protein